MLMTMDKELPKPLPISSALSRADFDLISRRAIEIQRELDAKIGPIGAEILTNVKPCWHVLITVPGHEKIALEHLMRRGFGCYLPEREGTEIRRGRKVNFTRLLLPGYLFVFVWDIHHHIDRIRACTGVYDALFINGHAAVIADWEIDRVRAEENRERPLRMAVEVNKSKRRWRQSNKATKLVDVHDYDIVSVRSKSAFLDALDQETEAERLTAFHKAMGLTQLPTKTESV